MKHYLILGSLFLYSCLGMTGGGGTTKDSVVLLKSKLSVTGAGPDSGQFFLKVEEGADTLFRYLEKSASGDGGYQILLDFQQSIVEGDFSLPSERVRAFVSYLGNGPSWSCELFNGEIVAAKDSVDNRWNLFGKALVSGECDKRMYGFNGLFSF